MATNEVSQMADKYEVLALTSTEQKRKLHDLTFNLPLHRKPLTSGQPRQLTYTA